MKKKKKEEKEKKKKKSKPDIERTDLDWRDFNW